MEVGGAAVLGGLAWFLLVPATELERRNLLSYDAYNRLLAVPLLFFVIASYLAPRALAVQGRLARLEFSVAAVGAGLLFAGNLIELYGVLLQDELNAYAAGQAGRGDDRPGSAPQPNPSQMADRVHGHSRIGVLAGNLIDRVQAFISVPVLALYAIGWISLGRLSLPGRR